MARSGAVNDNVAVTTVDGREYLLPTGGRGGTALADAITDALAGL